MDLVYIVKLLFRKIKLLIIVPLVCMILTFLLSIDMPNEYQSEAQLSTGFTVNESVINADEFNIRDAGIKFINAIETMKSPIVLNLVSYKLLINDLTDNSSFTSLTLSEAYEDIDDESGNMLSKEEIISILEEKVNNFKLLNNYEEKENIILKVLRQYEYDYETLLKKIEIYRVSMSDFIKISFVSESPLLSAYVVNTLAEEFIRYRKSTQSNINTESLAYYDNILNKKKEEISKKTKELNQIKSSGNVIDFQVQSETQLQQISNYETEKDNSIQKIQAIEISIQNINKKINNLNTSVIEPEGQSNQRLLDLQNKIKELNKAYINSGSSDQELKKMIDQLRAQLVNEINRLSDKNEGNNDLNLKDLISQKEDYQLELEIEKNNLKNLENKLLLLKGNMSGIANKEAIISSLNKEIEKLTDEYLNTLDVYNKEKNKSLVSDNNIKLIVPGQPAEEPESSKRIILIVLSGFLSFFILFGYFTSSILLNTKLKTPAIFENHTKLNLSGVINRINNDNNLDIDKIFNKNTANNESEKFKQFLRKFRHEIEQLNDKILLITSTKNGEGKTFIILSLAYSLSLIDKKVLIIDTNFKNNSLTKILINDSINKNLITEGAFTNLLANPYEEEGTIDEKNSNKSIINATMHRNIDIIGNQAHDNSPSEIFTGRDFYTMLQELSYTYDYILLEGAALNEYSDTKELVSYVDKVIPVFSADNSLSSIDKESIKYLKSLNGKLSGSILNKINLKDLKI